MHIIGTEAVGFIIGNVILTLPTSILLVFAPDKTNLDVLIFSFAVM